MSQRYLHTYLTKIKVSQDRGAAGLADGETLAMVLAETLHPFAVWMYRNPQAVGMYEPPQAEWLAQAAAAVGLRRARKCFLYFFSPAGGFQLLRDGRRGIIPDLVDQEILQASVAGRSESTTPAAELAWSILRAMIHLSERLCVYITAYEVRESGWGWKGRLARIIGLGNQGQLSEHFERLAQIDEELCQALFELSASSPGTDRVLQLVEVVIDVARKLPDGDPLTDAKSFEKVLMVVLDHADKPDFGSDLYSELADAINRVTERLGSLSSSMVGAAARGLHGIVVENATNETHSVAVVALLEQLPQAGAQHAPAKVLADIAEINPDPATAGLSSREVLAREDLLNLMLAQLDPHSPAWDVFLNFLLGSDFETARNDFDDALPGPAMLDRAWIDLAVEIIQDWKDRMDRYRAVMARPRPTFTNRDAFALQDIPRELWDDSDARNLDRAATELQDWQDNDPPPAWTHDPDGVEPAIRAALFAATLDDLHRMLKRIYEAKRTLDSLEIGLPLVEAILIDPGNQQLWPSPAAAIGALDLLGRLGAFQKKAKKARKAQNKTPTPPRKN